jgi:hypothetical protein
LEGSSGKRQVEVLTKADLQKEYLLVKAKLHLLKKEPTLATQLTSMSLKSLCTAIIVSIFAYFLY